MNVQEHFLSVNERRVRYFRAGESGPAVVLLHGAGVDAAMLSWGLLMPLLAETHRVFAPDFPGYGESEIPKEGLTFRGYVPFVCGFLDEIGVDTTSLVGISMGGAVALGFTLEHQQRVERLVLVDSYGLQRRAPFHLLSYLFIKIPGINWLTWRMLRRKSMVRYSLRSLLRRPGSLTDELVNQAMIEVMRPNASKAMMLFQNEEITPTGTRTCYLDRLAEIRVPTLIVHGTKDNLVPVESAREAHVRIRGSRLHWVDGSGHWPQRDHPNSFNRAVIAFLNEKED